jgi:hypothetical protein
MWKRLTKGGVAGFYINMLTGQEKNNLKTQQIYFSFYNLSKSNAPKAMDSTPQHTSPPGRTASSITPPSLLLFLVGCCVLVCSLVAD